MRNFIACLLLGLCLAAEKPGPAVHTNASKLTEQPDAWFTSTEGRQVVANIISWQNPEGGWAKGYRADHPHKPGEAWGEWDGVGTIDNKFTYSEVVLLARAYSATKDPAQLEAFNRGIDFLLKMQYPSGGWPQRYPPPDNYGRNITLNDDAMMHVMGLLLDIASGKPPYEFVDAERRLKSRAAVDRGIDFIIKSQIVSDGKLTAWCQQHDPQTLLPTTGRAYELPSIGGGESAGVVMFLMRLDNPSPEVKRAVHAATAWYDASKITGKRMDRKTNASGKAYDEVMVDDPAGEPLWARFYEIDTNRPFVCNRDGSKHYSLDEIEAERRVGYAWFRPYGRKVLAEYADWTKKHGAADPAALLAKPRASADSAPGANLVVASDGSAQFNTVQAAVDSIVANNTTRVVVQIKPGVYKERIRVPKDKRMVSFLGEDAAKTVLTWNYAAKSVENGKEVGTSGSYSTLIEGDDFVARNITFENSAGAVGQAVALRTTGERQAFFNCRMLGWQDTLYLHQGTQYLKDCHVEGRVDFIFGRSTAVLENCTIVSKNGGYVTAQKADREQPFGFVFINCKLTGDAPTYLGRPWGPDAAVAFINCEMGSHIRPEGWHNWDKSEREATVRYLEYKSTGPGANPTARVKWSRQLTDDDAQKFTRERVLGDWKPVAPD